MAIPDAQLGYETVQMGPGSVEIKSFFHQLKNILKKKEKYTLVFKYIENQGGWGRWLTGLE